MNILINYPSKQFNNDPNTILGGIESLNLDLAKILYKKKHIIKFSTNSSKIFYKNKIQFIPINQLKKNYVKYNFDCVISSNDATIFNLFPKSKKILWLHNPLQIEKSIRKKQFTPILRNKIIAVFVSKYLNKITSNLFFFKKRVVISNFLDSSFTKRIPHIVRKPIFIWSVQRSRGLNETIKVWIEQVHPFFKNAKFYIFGITKLPKPYNKKILLSKNIFFYGKVKKVKLLKNYSKSTAMICLGYDETFCLNALEANACGLPVITFGKTALNEIIHHNKNGFIINNFNDIATKIHYLINLKKEKKIKLIINSIRNSKKFYLNNIINHWLRLLK